MDTIAFMTSVNFEFLRPGNEVLANLGGLAEAVLHVDPGSALTRLRSFAEELTKTIYKEETLPRLPQASFYDLVKSPVFADCVSKSLIHQINFLRIQGNDAAHGAEGDLRNAQLALKTAHQLAMYMAVKYYGVQHDTIPEFVEVADPTAAIKGLQQSVSAYEKELNQKQEALQQVIAELEQQRTRNIEMLEPPARPDQQKRQRESQQVADSLQWNEAKTRTLLIDAMLLQAGWDVANPAQVGHEVEVDFPDNPSGKGRADYVLWSDNGQPLAVIEAKKSGNASLQAGREQARMYADGFERMGMQRPVIFYSNGYETFIWDDTQYNTYRPVYGLYSKDSLEYLIYQRQYRVQALEKHNPQLSIADRPYQIEAIKTVAAHFQSQRRKALIIQATGTGKTRVAIALAELLLRTGWAKRVLFLCDRKELRVQADDAFKQNLPSEPRCVIGETSKVDQTARIFIATYPGMMNRFAQLDVGFFDLIIADESHRSIYNKYRDLFEVAFLPGFIRQVEKVEDVGVAQVMFGIILQRLGFLLCFLLDSGLVLAGEQALVIQRADLALQCADAPVLIRRLIRIPLPGSRVLNTHQGSIVAPAQNTTQCVVFWESQVELPHIAQVAHIKPFAKLGLQAL
jgi:type I restriction enzyme, R subunit